MKSKTLGLRPKPRLEPSFGEGSKNSKNFTAKGTRRGGSWRHVLRFRVPFAVKLWGSWSFFRKGVPSGVRGGSSKSSPSLRSIRKPGVGRGRAHPHPAFRPPTSSVHPAPLSPTCHPERSGTTHQKSSAITKHCRTANPAPSGAPAGGISFAERYHTTPRTTPRPASPHKNL